MDRVQDGARGRGRQRRSRLERGGTAAVRERGYHGIIDRTVPAGHRGAARRPGCATAHHRCGSRGRRGAGLRRRAGLGAERRRGVRRRIPAPRRGTDDDEPLAGKRRASARRGRGSRRRGACGHPASRPGAPGRVAAGACRAGSPRHAGRSGRLAVAGARHRLHRQRAAVRHRTAATARRRSHLSRGEHREHRRRLAVGAGAGQRLPSAGEGAGVSREWRSGRRWGPQPAARRQAIPRPRRVPRGACAGGAEGHRAARRVAALPDQHPRHRDGEARRDRRPRRRHPRRGAHGVV